MKTVEQRGQEPTLECKGLCQDSCGPVPMTAEQVATLQDASGETYSVSPFPMFPTMFILQLQEGGYCPALDVESGKCKGYEGRPRICRLFGMVEKMKCPHGCEPSRWITDEEAAIMIPTIIRSED